MRQKPCTVQYPPVTLFALGRNIGFQSSFVLTRNPGEANYWMSLSFFPCSSDDSKSTTIPGDLWSPLYSYCVSSSLLFACMHSRTRASLNKHTRNTHNSKRSAAFRRKMKIPFDIFLLLHSFWLSKSLVVLYEVRHTKMEFSFSSLGAICRRENGIFNGKRRR